MLEGIVAFSLATFDTLYGKKWFGDLSESVKRACKVSSSASIVM